MFEHHSKKPARGVAPGRSVCALVGEMSDYVEIGESEARALPASYGHAAHVMVYSAWPGRFMGKYEYGFAVSVSPRQPGVCRFALAATGAVVDAAKI